MSDSRPLTTHEQALRDNDLVREYPRVEVGAQQTFGGVVYCWGGVEWIATA